MHDLVLSRQVQSLIWQEREKVLTGVVKLVGSLSREVVNEMAGVGANGSDSVVEELPVVEVRDKLNTSPGTAALETTGIEDVVAKVIDERFAHVLQDISYRIGVLNDVTKSLEGLPHKVTSQHLNLAHHLLDGYTFTANSPSAGYVAWTDCHIVYQGSDYNISNSSTNKKYIYWLHATPSAFQTENVKPSISATDCLVAINENGVPVVVLVPGKMQSGAALLDSTVSSSELGSGAVTSAKIAASAIFSNHITPSAVSSTHLVDNAVISTKLADGHVVSTKLADGHVVNSKLAASAVDSSKLAASAVTSTKIADGNIVSTKIADGNITEIKLASNAVTSAKLADGAVTGTKIGAGAVATSKLNLAAHMLY